MLSKATAATSSLESIKIRRVGSMTTASYFASTKNTNNKAVSFAFQENVGLC